MPNRPMGRAHVFATAWVGLAMLCFSSIDAAWAMPDGDRLGRRGDAPVQMKLFGNDGRAIPPESIQHVFSPADLEKISKVVARRARQRSWPAIAKSVLWSQEQLEFAREGIVPISSARWPQVIELGVEGVVDLGKGRFARIVYAPMEGSSSTVRLNAFACTRDGEDQQLEPYRWLKVRGSDLKTSDGKYRVRTGDAEQLQQSDSRVELAPLGHFFHKFLGAQALVAQTLRPKVILFNSHYPHLPITVIEPRTNLLIQVEKQPKGKAIKPGLRFYPRPTKAPRKMMGPG